MSLYISIVSHDHAEDIIHNLQPHRLHGEQIHVAILANQADSALQSYCEEHKLSYLQNETPLGFGANHNKVFCYCREELGLRDEDWFLVLNPDVLVSPQTIGELLVALRDYYPRLAAANLFKDQQLTTLENSVRRFPYLWDFFGSLIFKSTRTTIKRQHLNDPCHVNWASGAFLVFQAELYAALGGFDERYYLYCEDVDICWRAHKLFGVRTLYLPQIKAVHAGRRDSHKSINQHMLWHISSAFRFSWVRLKTRLLGAKTLRRTRINGNEKLEF